MNKKIFLIGLPGSGKTTMGLDLAIHLSLPFVDLDQEIEKAEKQSISRLFEQNGESYFRQLEALHLKKIIQELPQFIMACGGGTPCFFDNMKMMNSSGTTVFVNTPISHIAQRLKDDTTRPLLQNTELSELLKNRLKWYSKATYTISNPPELISLFD